MFTYPFHYTPHPLCVCAAEEVQHYLQSRSDWHEELQQGKMFGVLVVRTPDGTIGFLAAFSGNLAGSNHHDYFVPPVYDLLNPDGYFKEEEARISSLNVILRSAPLNDTYLESLKEERKNRSIALQQWIFQQFRLRNALGEEQDIHTIFAETAHRNPPAGTGECAAPKLLQYAYLHQLQPLAMAEFWWGNSPKGEIRRHGHYYPACRHKCEPILGFMLRGLEVEPNPLLISNTDATQLETVYEDEYLLVVNKPAGMLSVPGKTGQASVLSILQERYPEATGPLLVHRLDMATSGLLLAAKDKDTHALLQKQFEGRTVKKRYIALLDGPVTGKEPKGFIRLPLRPDFDNRPLQMVCFEYGKPAVTRYEILGHVIQSPYTRIALYPETGRTHQLRVHAAHPDGLNCPIVGDPLYGQPADRLYLHAERLEFKHPVTGKYMHIQKEAPF
ncbi:MAG: RluA family pseudouridine synthase [Bacteroides sp.]|nr:RluA family pseudouridine synthase [Bacteroides sp.]